MQGSGFRVPDSGVRDGPRQSICYNYRRWGFRLHSPSWPKGASHHRVFMRFFLCLCRSQRANLQRANACARAWRTRSLSRPLSSRTLRRHNLRDSRLGTHRGDALDVRERVGELLRCWVEHGAVWHGSAAGTLLMLDARGHLVGCRVWCGV